jgi:biotin carboxylase
MSEAACYCPHSRTAEIAVADRPLKTAVFLTERYLDTVDLKAVADPLQYRLVAIVREDARARFPADKAPLFAAIHSVPSGAGRALLPELDPARARAVVAAEIARAGAPERVGIVCADEGNVLLAGRLRDEFGIPGVGEAQATLFRNKIEMKKRLGERGVRVPRHRRIDRAALEAGCAAYFEALAAELGVPFILKPVQEVSAFGVFKVSTAADMEATGRWLRSIPYEAEEFVAGRLYHVDSLVQGGRTIFAECGELTWPALDYLGGKPLGSLPLPDADPLRRRLLDFADGALAALGAPEGATHMEVFVTPADELVFLEVAGRIPGALIVPTYERAYGVNMLAADFLIQMGVPLTRERRALTHCCWVIFPCATGRVVNVVAPELRSEHRLQWLVQPGDELREGESMLDRVGTLVAWNGDYAILRDDFERLRNHSALHVQARAA